MTPKSEAIPHASLSWVKPLVLFRTIGNTVGALAAVLWVQGRPSTLTQHWEYYPSTHGWPQTQMRQAAGLWLCISGSPSQDCNCFYHKPRSTWDHTRLRHGMAGSGLDLFT